jgi:translocation and assembly module TamB
VLKVDVGGEGYNVFGTTRVEVGKYLTDNLYVSYTHQFGSMSGTRRMNSNQLQLEYQFLRSFALETLFGDAGVGALDFYWTKRF